jgi:hypothetical protein
MLAIVEGEVGHIPPRVEAMIWTETIVGIFNKVHIQTCRRAIDAQMSCLSALFTCHASIDHFEVVKAQIFKFLHAKINHGGEHIHLFK